MSAFRAVAIPTEVVDYVRTEMKAPTYGFPAHKEMTTSRAPCRHCLQLIRMNEEELILFTYDAFHGQGVPPLPGPVYLHAKNCGRYAEGHGFPEEYRGRLLTLEAYGAGRKRIAEVQVKNGEEESAAAELLAKPEVQYIHVRSTEAGCYLFRLERC